MSEKTEYTKVDIQELKWNEHIRKRPGMYLGHVNEKGFIDMLKGIMSSAIASTDANKFSIELKDNSEARFRFNNQKGKIENNWGQFKRNPTNPFLLEIFALNALSKKFRISFWNSNQEKIGEEYFEEGEFIKGEEIETISCSTIEVEFVLDESIWGTEFKWNKIYLTHQLREFAYLYKRTKFEITYQEDNENCRLVYHFKNGLKDMIDIEILNGLGGSYFETEIDEKIEDFQVEAAFAFRDYSVDAPYLKSYVNDYFTFENGTHVDGLPSTP
jgi:DNA gyrase/topoisomerase IV subunit B